MIDNYGRSIDYLRVSVTKKCNLRCVYCGIEREQPQKEMTAEEIEKAVRAFAALGITKVRLTGGEPLVRQDITDIARRISSVEGIEKLMLTTNGVLLKDCAHALKQAGVQGVNISLDTTDKEQYKQITGADRLDRVLEGIDEAERAGLSPIRINTVLMRGRNDNTADELVNLAKNRKIDVRFIELMPFSNEGEELNNVVTGAELLQRFPFLIPEGKEENDRSAARYCTADGFKGRVGFITPVSDKFCLTCNRIRLLSDGKIKPCLADNAEFDIMNVLDDEEELKRTIHNAILSKPESHRFFCGCKGFHGLNRIGG